MKKIYFTLSLIWPLTLTAQWNVTAVINDTAPASNQYKLKVLAANTIMLYPSMSYYDTLIKKSTDGGLTWQNINLPANAKGTMLRDADFINSDIGYIVGGTPYGNWNTLIKTTDGGNNWHDMNNSFLAKNGSYSIYFVDFTDENNGYIVSDDGLHKTNDGGNSFRHIPLTYIDTTYNTSITAIHFIHKDKGWLALQGYRYADSAYMAYILKTQDGGSSWSVHDITHWKSEDLWYKTDKIQFVTNRDGFAIGSRGQLKVSNNGGNTWLNKNLPLADGIATDMYFVNDACGYIVLNNSIYRTNDAGNSWALQTMNSDTAMVNYISFANDSVGYALGNYLSFTAKYATLLGTQQTSGSPLSLVKNKLRSSFRIYPNPANDWIELSYSGGLKINDIQLVDISGRIIKHFNKTQKVLDIKGVASGVYFLTIQTSEGKAAEQLIIN